jgi:hypothetical protein
MTSYYGVVGNRAQQGRYAEKRGWRSQSLVQMGMVL